MHWPYIGAGKAVKYLQPNFPNEQHADTLPKSHQVSHSSCGARNAGVDLLTKGIGTMTTTDPLVWRFWDSDFRTCCVLNRSVSIDHNHGTIPWTILPVFPPFGHCDASQHDRVRPQVKNGNRLITKRLPLSSHLALNCLRDCRHRGS